MSKAINREELQKQLKKKDIEFNINLPANEKLKLLEKVEEKFAEYLLAMGDAGYANVYSSLFATNQLSHIDRYKESLESKIRKS